MNADDATATRILTAAVLFACEAHANQRRKGAAQEPYINHLAEVADLVARASGGEDTELVVAALLHDVLEDTQVLAAEVAERFGDRVLELVSANSDDMSLPKDERRRQRIAAMAHKSPEAKLIKMADVISNVRAIAHSPPAGWSAAHRLGYAQDCRNLLDAARGTSALLEAEFDHTLAEVERQIRAGMAPEAATRDAAVRHLESAIGQAVHLVHLPNTACVAIEDTHVDRLCQVIAQTFPSAIVQRHEAIFEGRRRPILTARIRTDSTDAIVALAQSLCLEFDQRFVGVEVGGRYIRVYADDTG